MFPVHTGPIQLSMVDRFDIAPDGHCTFTLNNGCQAYGQLNNATIDALVASIAFGKINFHCIDRQDNKGETLLFKACLQGHSNLVDRLLRSQANPNLASFSGERPIHVAAQLENEPKALTILGLLVHYHAQVNVITHNGDTPLHFAPLTSTNVHTYLLNQSPGLAQLRNKEGDTYLSWCAEDNV